MVIRLTDSADAAATGRVTSTMGSFTTSLPGDNTPTPDFDGSFQRAMSPFTAELQQVPQKNFNPGHWITHLRNATNETFAGRQSTYDAVADLPYFVGCVATLAWSDLETSKGVYDMASLRTEFEYVQSLGKKFGLRIRPEHYGEFTQADATHIPTYIHNEGGVWFGNNGAMTRLWEETFMDYLMLLHDAIEAEFGQEEDFELVHMIKETATQFAGNNDPTYSSTKWTTQLQRMINNTSSYTNTRIQWTAPINWLFGSGVQGTYDALVTQKGSWANTDVCPTCGMPGDAYYIGTLGTTDYRGKIPGQMVVEVSELIFDSVGPDGGFSAFEIWDYANNTQNATHLIWDYHEIATGSLTINGVSRPFENQTWAGTNGIRDTARDHPMTTTTYPSYT